MRTERVWRSRPVSRMLDIWNANSSDSLAFCAASGSIFYRYRVLGFVSGIFGSTETAQGQVSIGMGMVAGSTVLLLTIIWGSCVIVRKCDLVDSIAQDAQDTKGSYIAVTCFVHIEILQLELIMFPLYKKKLKSSVMSDMIAYKRRPNHYKVESLAPIFRSIASGGIYPNSYQLSTVKSLIGPFELSWKLMPLLVSGSSQLNRRPREHLPPPNHYNLPSQFHILVQHLPGQEDKIFCILKNKRKHPKYA
ncbi:sodium/calcium exchanger ncl [Quercus suber]|uniref:Sodium/calcium exchanger ncl n=1 Tax=Quercus suber TaxID=58331 RepID=A0AAW0K9R4_QUESU